MQTKKSGTGEILKKELLDVLLDGENLRLDLASLVLGDAGSDHWARHTAGPTVKKAIVGEKLSLDSVYNNLLDTLATPLQVG